MTKVATRTMPCSRQCRVARSAAGRERRAPCRKNSTVTATPLPVPNPAGSIAPARQHHREHDRDDRSREGVRKQRRTFLIPALVVLVSHLPGASAAFAYTAPTEKPAELEGTAG